MKHLRKLRRIQRAKELAEKENLKQIVRSEIDNSIMNMQFNLE